MRQIHPLRILIVDDHGEWRVKTHFILEAKPTWEVIGEACNGLQAIQLTSELFPDLVLLDIGMPILNGVEAARRIREAFPTTKVIFLTQEDDADIRKAAFAAGADEYILKANAATDLVPAIEAVYGLSIAFITPSTRQESVPVSALP